MELDKMNLNELQLALKVIRSKPMVNLTDKDYQDMRDINWELAVRKNF